MDCITGVSGEPSMADDADERVFSAYMKKEGHFFKTWRRRWMQFDGVAGKLRYWKTKEQFDAKETPRGVDTVGDATVGTHKGKKVVILTCRNGKMYFIEAESDEDRLRAQAAFADRVGGAGKDGGADEGGSASRIQALFRGKQTRKSIKLTQGEKNVRAISTAQRFARGLLARTRVSKMEMKKVRPMKLLIRRCVGLTADAAAGAKDDHARRASTGSASYYAPKPGSNLQCLVSLVFHPSADADPQQRFCFKLPDAVVHETGGA
eukprot:g5334.t1